MQFFFETGLEYLSNNVTLQESTHEISVSIRDIWGDITFREERSCVLLLFRNKSAAVVEIILFINISISIIIMFLSPIPILTNCKRTKDGISPRNPPL